MNRSLTIVLSGFLMSACIPATVTKSPGAFGRVTNARTHAAIVGAQVSFPRESKTTVTSDREGRFDLPYEKKLGIIVLLPFEFQSVTLQVVHPRYDSFTTKIYTATTHGHQDIALQPKQ